MKPGKFTTEWWTILLSFLAAVAAFIVAHVNNDTAVEIAAMVAGVLGPLGYSWQRSALKKAELGAATANVAADAAKAIAAGSPPK